MKRVSKLIYIALAFCGVSCSSYLDINDVNPNRPTNVQSNLILPNALTATANVLNGHNSVGGQIGGYMANAGGYGGFNELITYQYTPSTYDVWGGTYDNMEDYQYIINRVASQMASGDSSNINFYAVAMTMRSHNFQLIVDTYNNAPYSDALKGADNLTPAYDDAATIYKGLGDDLDVAAKMFRRGAAIGTVNDVADYNGNSLVTMFHQFANTLKLKLMVRAQGKVTFTTTSFDNTGFLTSDCSYSPGYKRDNGRQNPLWNNWAFTYTITAATKSWIPTRYIMGFYDGSTLSDVGRGKACFYLFPSTGTNQLGHEGNDIAKCPTGSFWYNGSDRDKAPGNVNGILKDPSQAYPYMLAAESYFLQAEAVERGMITSTMTDEQLFNAGVTASFRYLYSKADGSIVGDPVGDAKNYQFFENNNKLTNYSKCTSPDERIQAIITQKYIANNMIHNNEGWNEYRRTGYPVSATNAMTPTNSFASITSQSPNPDKLPTRIPYPVSEAQYNPTNLPTGISNFTSKIFWAK